MATNRQFEILSYFFRRAPSWMKHGLWTMLYETLDETMYHSKGHHMWSQFNNHPFTFKCISIGIRWEMQIIYRPIPSFSPHYTVRSNLPKEALDNPHLFICLNCNFVFNWHKVDLGRGWAKWFLLHDCDSFWLTNICVNTFWSTGIGALISLSSQYTNSSPLWSTFAADSNIFCQKYIFYSEYFEFVWKVAADWRPTLHTTFLHLFGNFDWNFDTFRFHFIQTFEAVENGDIWGQTQICICQKLYLDCQRLTSCDLRDTNVKFLVNLKFAISGQHLDGFKFFGMNEKKFFWEIGLSPLVWHTITSSEI